jgi:hypothetical protein
MANDPSEFEDENFSDAEIPSTPNDERLNLQSIRTSVMNKGTVKKSDSKHQCYNQFHKTAQFQRTSQLSKPVPALFLQQQHDENKEQDKRNVISPAIRVHAFKNMTARGK